MKKRFLALLLCALLLCGSLLSAAESAPILPDAPEITNAVMAMVYEETTDTILFAKNIDRKTAPASKLSVKRSISALYSFMLCKGSMTLPFDLLIFSPNSSFTSACKYTSLKGKLFRAFVL